MRDLSEIHYEVDDVATRYRRQIDVDLTSCPRRVWQIRLLSLLFALSWQVSQQSVRSCSGFGCLAVWSDDCSDESGCSLSLLFPLFYGYLL